MNPMQDIQQELIFKRLRPQRPTVIRMRDTVKTCFYWEGTTQCLGPRCFWPKVGVCPIYNRIRNKFRAK